MYIDYHIYLLYAAGERRLGSFGSSVASSYLILLKNSLDLLDV
jgi:hypothetical protein